MINNTKKFNLFIFLFILFSSEISFGQNNFYVNDTIAKENTHCWNLQYVTSATDTINSADLGFQPEIVGNCLKLDLSYSGGCGDVYLKVLADTTQLNQMHPVRLYVNFNDKDFCKGIESRVVYIDLTYLKRKYKKPVQIKVGYNKKILTLN
jgi:hypothetical protein